MSRLTCVTCRLVFATAEDLREHFSSDVHEVNTVRGLEGHPPVSAATLRQMRAVESQLEQERDQKQGSVFCPACRKRFSSQRALEQHFQSKKHQQKWAVYLDQQRFEIAKKIALDSCRPLEDVLAETPISAVPDFHIESANGTEAAVVEDEEGPVILPPTSCLFCDHSSESVEDNLEHMYVHHGFFIPNAAYCDDVLSVLEVAATKICCDKMCLSCHKRFRTLERVRAHMADKGHSHFDICDAEDMEAIEPFYSEPDLPEDAVVPVEENEAYILLSDGQRIWKREAAEAIKRRDRPYFSLVPVERVEFQPSCTALAVSYRSHGHNAEIGRIQIAERKSRRIAQRRETKRAALSHTLHKFFRDDNPI